jgi:phosphonate degradation associated HDIG domain protein
MALCIEQITHLFRTQGALQYGAEAINQERHALQCAHMAEQSGASSALVTAALLHDLGHLLPKPSVVASGVDDLHQFLVIPFLRGLFTDAVLEPIRMHVDAKRYLCHVERPYWAGLSAASQSSLKSQGGPFSKAEAATFMTQPFALDAVALRRWDDLAKDPAAKTPPWAHYVAVLEKARADIGVFCDSR